MDNVVVRKAMLRALSIFTICGALTGAGCDKTTPVTLVSIAVTPTNPSIAAGTKQQFTATGTFSDGSAQDLTAQATWIASDPNVAAISSAGLATSVAKGMVTISATFGDKTDSTALTVTDATVVSIKVTPTSPSIPLGTEQRLTAMGIYSDSTTQDLTTQAMWNSSNQAVAMVSSAAGNEGLATPVAKGTVTISATFGGR